MQIAYAAGDDVLVTGGYDQAIRLWDCRSRSFDPIQTMKSFGDSVTSVAIADRQVTLIYTEIPGNQLYLHRPCTLFCLVYDTIQVL